MHPRSKELDPQGRAVIRDALKVATEEECIRAIDGCKASDWHMGGNPRGKRYNRLTNILKGKRGGKTTREQIDMFLDYAEDAGSPRVGMSEGRIAHLKDAIETYVQTGAEQARAERASEALVEAGIYSRIDFDRDHGKAVYAH